MGDTGWISRLLRARQRRSAVTVEPPQAETETDSLKRYVVIDCETTGLSTARGDRMVSFAAIEILGVEPSGRSLSLIFNPGRNSDPRARSVHRLSDHLLRHQSPFSSSRDIIHDFLADAVIVGHNVQFDLSFLSHEFALCGSRWHQGASICTQEAFQGLGMGRASLDAAAAHFDIDISARAEFHGAFIDAEITSQLFQRMVLGKEVAREIAHLPPTNFVEPPPLVQSAATTKAGHGVQGLAFAITGELTNMTRDEAADLVERLGGIWHKAVKKDTDFLVIGHAPGNTKIETAAARRARYGKPDNIDEAQFLRFIDSSVQANNNVRVK
ncbi:DNA polymerase-3 subunit epsilon [Azospirillum agricola]|uniref:exonuclease domain-containing protein n=1 Tax=Azospirillum agricola TaxID=1720247 RepID=UPI001AE30E2B|nr:exonuclease domain-containing protein [Azospirillum agricola]MBP2232494.1 DNA polymerase-3 subunit epsilon [Azospirillum agricola]